MSPSPSRAARTRRAAPVFGALIAAGALLLSPTLTAAAAAPSDAAGAVALAAAPSALTLSKTQFAVGDSITASYATDRPTTKNWVAIYSAAQASPCSGCGFAWAYAAGESGQVTIPLDGRDGADLPPGDYRLEYLYNDGWTRAGEPVSFTIVGDTQPPVGPQPGDADAPVTIDPIVTDRSTDGVIAREGFAGSSLPAGWTVETDAAAGADAYRGWSLTTRDAWTSQVDQMRGRFARPLDGLIVADAQQFGGALETTLTGAPVSVDGLAKVRLTFDSHYRGAAGQAGSVSVSFDGGASTEVLGLDSTTVTDGYDERQMNFAQDIVVDVPVGADDAVFSWHFAAGESARYWAIDSVAVHAVQKATTATPTQAWIMSDIQGHPHDWQHAIGDYAEIAPDADGMLIVGDVVNSGQKSEWDEIYAVMDATEDVRPRQTIAAMGNHERYAAGGYEANRDRFLAFAERDQVWDEYVVEGPSGDVPVIVLGQEFAGPSDVAMSNEQVEFLEERLAHWTALDKQVVVITHYPLGDTVSASWFPSYHRHHQMNDRLTSILGNYPNAIIFTGHTHYPAEQGDWAVQRRTADGHADGFWAVNTTAMHVEWDAIRDGKPLENTAQMREVTTGDINRGLTLDAYGDRVVVTAYDFAADTQLRQVTIPNPLVPFDAQVAAPAVSYTHLTLPTILRV